MTREGAGGTRSYEFARRFVERGHGVRMVTAGQARTTVDGIDVVGVRGAYSDYMRATGMSNLGRTVAFARFAAGATLAALRFVYARSARLIALSPGIQAALPPGRTELVPNSADLDLFDPEPPDGPFQIAYFGAMGEANDLAAVVEAAGLVPDVRFVLMGDGKRRAELERTAPPNVSFRSGSKTDVARLAAESSACLTVFKDVPVLATNSPNKLFDTFAAGRAAIVNMDGWMRELVERDGAGVYVRAGDAGDLAEKVAWLRDNPDEVRRMGGNARALAEREFGRDELARRALAVLEDAAR